MPEQNCQIKQQTGNMTVGVSQLERGVSDAPSDETDMHPLARDRKAPNLIWIIF